MTRSLQCVLLANSDGSRCKIRVYDEFSNINTIGRDITTIGLDLFCKQCLECKTSPVILLLLPIVSLSLNQS